MNNIPRRKHIVDMTVVNDITFLRCYKNIRERTFEYITIKKANGPVEYKSVQTLKTAN